jgi:NitT/TauT family transport system substrate-binding protein
MDENENHHFVEEIEESGLTRGDLLKRAAGVGVGLSALGMFEVQSALGASELTKVKWISPRGTLDVMDDFNLWVPITMGYFRRLGIDLSLSPGDGSGNLPQVAAGQINMAYPSPGVLTSSIEAGVPVISIWEQYPAQVFDFVLNGKSRITHPRQLRGKTIALLTDGWASIVNPMLAEVGVSPKSVKYRVFGPQWVQAVALGQADAGLVWEGLRAQLVGQSATFGSAFQLKFLVGSQWGSKGPSNTYVVRTSDLQDAQKKELYSRVLQGSVMGSEFAKANPRAAAQITYGARPLLQKLISPQVALESMMQLATGYSVFHRRPPHLYGWHDPASWNRYLDAIAKLGQTKKRLNIKDVLTNDMVRAANQKADVARARRDARAYKLNEFFRTTTVPKGYPL